MESTDAVPFDEARYRHAVLQLPSEESENTREQALVDEARQLGLNVPEVDTVTSIAASIASGIIDLSSASPIISSGSSTDRNSSCDVTPSHETTPPLDQVASSLSEFTIASDPTKCGSTRSIASLSTRPTSYSSSEGRLAADQIPTALPRIPNPRDSVWSVASSEKKERRKSSLKSAIGRIHFRKKRSPSSVNLPAAAQITLAKGDNGVNKVYVETRPTDASRAGDSPEEQDNRPLKLEIPVFDNESLQRALADVELRQMRETQTQERNRHIAFQNTFMSELRRKQQAVVADRLASNKQLEEEKREKNTTDAIRMEERQLTIEIEQVREFERAKMNSRTRIKYMEGYFSSASPPNPSGESTSPPNFDPAAPARTFTSQQKAQLAQEYHDHKSMDQLHESKIKVLRDRQEIRLRDAIARMEKELDQLIDKHALEFAEMQRAHQDNETAVVQAFDAKKAMLRHRWNLEEAVVRRKLEMRHDLPYGPLPPLLFSDPHYETRDSAICVSDRAGTPSGDEDPAYQKKKGAPVL